MAKVTPVRKTRPSGNWPTCPKCPTVTVIVGGQPRLKKLPPHLLQVYSRPWKRFFRKTVFWVCYACDYREIV